MAALDTMMAKKLNIGGGKEKKKKKKNYSCIGGCGSADAEYPPQRNCWVSICYTSQNQEQSILRSKFCQHPSNRQQCLVFFFLTRIEPKKINKMK